MAQNKNKTDFLHSQLPTHLNSKTNANWSALIGAFGERDQEVSDLIEEVRKQFFINNCFFINTFSTIAAIHAPFTKSRIF